MGECGETQRLGSYVALYRDVYHIMYYDRALNLLSFSHAMLLGKDRGRGLVDVFKVRTRRHRSEPPSSTRLTTWSLSTPFMITFCSFPHFHQFSLPLPFPMDNYLTLWSFGISCPIG